MSDLLSDLKVGADEVRETHISWVFLHRETVLKLKKPVDFGFLDFTTAEKRRAACEAEVVLNARLAPGVYLGVVPIVRSADGRHRVGPEGAVGDDIVDWAVHMRRLSDVDRADVRLAEGRLPWPHLEAFAGKLARFHAEAATSLEIERYGDVSAIAANVRQNFAQAHAPLSSLVSDAQQVEVEAYQLQFLQRHEELFQRRIAQGRVRDGHGDLRLEHLYIDETGVATVIDCIEFNERFRFADVCADVAFLSMDLAWHDRVDYKERFLAAYARESNDYDLYALVDFYESYRAYVRAKVSALGLASPTLSVEARRNLTEHARRYFLLALASERPPLERPRLIAVGGLIASGKSSVAEALGAEIAAPVISSDRTRKAELSGELTAPVHVAAFREEYSEERTERVYAEVMRRARVVLASGRSVVIDASFRTRWQRSLARSLALELGVPFSFVECRAPEPRLRERLERRARGPSVSDGRLEIFDAFVRSYEPVTELSDRERVVLDTAGTLASSLAALRASGLLATS